MGEYGNTMCEKLAYMYERMSVVSLYVTVSRRHVCSDTVWVPLCACQCLTLICHLQSRVDAVCTNFAISSMGLLSLVSNMLDLVTSYDCVVVHSFQSELFVSLNPMEQMT